MTPGSVRQRTFAAPGLRCRKKTTVLPGRLLHHCHIVETDNEPYRVRHNTATARARTKARGPNKKGTTADEIELF